MCVKIVKTRKKIYMKKAYTVAQFKKSNKRVPGLMFPSHI